MKGKRVSVLVMGLMLASAAMAAEQPVAPGKPAPVPVDGMICVSETGQLDTPWTRPYMEPMGPIPQCPTNFSNCPDVPGRNCSLQNCVTIELGPQCKKGNRIIGCEPPATIHQTTCDCEEQFHQTCCDDDTCGFECGVCAGGSLATFCQ
jgi:hypothetical protein